MGVGASKENLASLNVVIIGAGYAGTQVAAGLKQAGVAFKIIDEKEYFHHCVGALRASVYPEFGPHTALPLKAAFGDSFIQATVKGLDTDKNLVRLDNGEEVPFTHCIVAVGSLGPSPARSNQVTIAGLQEEYARIAETIAEAKSIILVGGGAVGVELAGEIRDKHKDKKITIVHSSSKLVSPNFDEKFYKSIANLMQSCNVQVVTGRVTNLSSLKLNTVSQQTVTTESDSIQGDLVISCVGLPPNKASISSLLPGTTDDQGRIKVNEFLQVEGFTHIFAIGDCTNTKEDKMAAHAGKHGESVVANIITEAQGGKMKAYQSAFVGMLVPVGKCKGVGMINGWHLPGFAVVLAKSGDLFTGKFWQNLGLQRPALH